MSKIINVGIIGLGIVGTGTAKILIEQAKTITEKINLKVVIKTIVDLDITTDRKINLKGINFTKNVDDIILDDSIDIVVELIGGINLAKKFIKDSIKKGKHIVTANKALLASFGKELFELAEKNNVIINFEASVGGGIPIIKTLKEGLVSNSILSMYGIINGTANYILTNMSKYNKPFDEVLKEAQDKGFAEADPTFDIEGNDTAHKLAVISTLAYGIPVVSDEIHCEGITQITTLDMKYAHILNYEIKLLAIAKSHNKTLDLRVHPTLIPKDSILAQTSFENNAVYLEGDNVGPVMLYGKGAGMMPTASAVVSDIIDISKKITSKVLNLNKYYYSKKAIKIIPMFALKTKYYLRLTTKDKPYVLSKISKILGDNGISIDSLIQTETKEDGSAVIIIMTHPAIEKAIMNAVKSIKKLSFVKKDFLTLRVEE